MERKKISVENSLREIIRIWRIWAKENFSLFWYDRSGSSQIFFLSFDLEEKKRGEHSFDHEDDWTVRLINEIYDWDTHAVNIQTS